jgi:hypothetical protein
MLATQTRIFCVAFEYRLYPNSFLYRDFAIGMLHMRLAGVDDEDQPAPSDGRES